MNRILILLSIISFAGAVSAADWPQFRGANQDGISPDSGIVGSWPDGGPKKVWTFEDAGMGYSSYSIVGDKLYTLGTKGDAIHAICINAETGAAVWSQPFADDDQKGYSTGWGHGPRSTPTVDGDKIFVYGPKGTIACLSASDGDVLWSRKASEFGGKAGGWGYSESPVVDGNKVLVAPGGEAGAIVALEKGSGETVWQSNVSGAGKAEYATIVIAEIHGKRQYIKLFQNQVVGVDAGSGEVLWSSEWPGKTAVIPTPIVDGNQVYVSSGYGVGCKLVEVNADWTTEDVWVNKNMKNHHGGVIKVGDHLYGFSDGPGLICQSWGDGEIAWNFKDRSVGKGSIAIADGKIICLNEGDGVCTLVAVDEKEYKPLGSFTLDPQSPNRHVKGKVWTHPVVLNGKLYLRDQEFITCYDIKG